MTVRTRRPPRTVRRLAALAALTSARLRLRTLELVSLSRADRLALDLWCTLGPVPRSHDRRPPGGELVRLPVPRGGSAVAEVWGDGPVVVLVHGWGGWRGQLGGLVEPLVAAGHRVVALDAPGHGDADPGMYGPRRGTVMECMEALEVALERFGPAAAVVAHSMGCTVASRVLAGDDPASPRAGRLVLVAPNHGFDEVVDQFAATLRLTERMRTRLVATIEEVTGRRLHDFDLAPLGADGSLPPTLVVHDRDDRETPYRVAEEIVATWPRTRLLTTRGLGHRRILADEAVVAAAVGHVTGRVPVA